MQRFFLKTEIEVTTASTEQVIQTLRNTKCSIYDLEIIDDLRFRFWVSGYQVKYVEKILQSQHIEYDVISSDGLIRYARCFIKRPVLVFGVVLIIFLTLYLPTRILFVRIEGADNKSQQIILDAAELCGVRFGASNRNVRNEYVKNTLLHLVPELKWAGVEINGCCVVISVVVRHQENVSAKPLVSNIIASIDGEICEMSVTQGSAQCAVGDSVYSGQILVSGTTDLGIKILKQRSKGEIYAYTTRQLDAIYVHPTPKSNDQQEGCYAWGILFGKKLVKIRNCSRNSHSTCGKLYKQWYVKLPGDFQLPVALYTVSGVDCDNTATMLPAHSLLEKYLMTQMLAGQILDSISNQSTEEDMTVVYATYHCREMIGRELEEEYDP